MNIGKLNRRIRIEQRSTTQESAYGTLADTWSTYTTVWAEVQEVLPSKGESQSDDIRIAQRPARVRFRYVEGITSAMRVVYLDRSSRVMKIISQPVEIGHRDGIEMIVADFTSTGAAA